MTRRILSVDGGGIKGVFAAAFLAGLQECVNEPIASYFDLAVGTSTGGIIALALGLNFSPQEVLDFYLKTGPEVFASPRLLALLRHLIRPKWKQTQLRLALDSVFGRRYLGESRLRLAIPSQDIESGGVYIYKTAHHPRLQVDYKVRAVEVAMATSAAPTYFATYVNSSGVPLVDGGTWANNPVGLAAVEAVAVCGWERKDLRILSLGCTSSPLNVASARGACGLVGLAPKLVDIFLVGQSSSSLGTAQLLAGHGNVFRFSPVTPRGRFQLDNPAQSNSLRGLGSSEARKALPRLKPVFFEEPAERFVPCFSL